MKRAANPQRYAYRGECSSKTMHLRVVQASFTPSLVVCGNPYQTSRLHTDSLGCERQWGSPLSSRGTGAPGGGLVAFGSEELGGS